MRYLAIPVLALVLNLVGAADVNAAPPSHSNARSLRQVPELDGKALPAALALLVGGTVVVLYRRRSKNPS